jgi:hypothetical protein
MSRSSNKHREWLDLLIALGAWTVAIFVGYIIFKKVSGYFF